MQRLRTFTLIWIGAAILTVALAAGVSASCLKLEGATLSPELTTYGDPATYVVTNHPSFYDGVARLSVTFSGGTFGGSAALLSGGRYLLTAAHMVSNGGSLPLSLTATFSPAVGPLASPGLNIISPAVGTATIWMGPISP